MSAIHDETGSPGEFRALRELLLKRLLLLFEHWQQQVPPAYREVVEAMQSYAASPTDLRSLDFVAKRAIRAFFGVVEVATTIMCESVVHLHWMAPGGMDERTIDEIQRFLPKSGSDVEGRKRSHRGLDHRMKVALSAFPQLLGSGHRPDFSGKSEHWFRFTELQRIRNGFTHPKRLVDLLGQRGLPWLLPCIAWYGDQLVTLIREAARSCGRNFDFEGIFAVNVPPADMRVKKEIERLFDSKFDQSVEASAASSMALLRFWIDIHGYEIRQSKRDLDQVLLKAEGPLVELCRRDFVQCLASAAESTIGFIEFFTAAALKRGEAMVTWTDLDKPDAESSIPSRLVAVTAEFSTRFGYGRILDRSSGFEAFSETVAVRDRLTHPRIEKELVLTDEELQRARQAWAWYAGIYDVLEPNPEKL